MKRAWNYAGFKKRLKKTHPELYYKYEKKCGFNSRLKSEAFYTAFISPFELPKRIRFREPTFVFPGTIDFHLLIKLVAASFSSAYKIHYQSYKDAYNSEMIPELYITVESHGAYITKGLHELWEFQLTKLFDIYITEFMSIYLLFKDAEAPNSVTKDQDERQAYFKKSINKMERNRLLFELKRSREKVGHSQ